MGHRGRDHHIVQHGTALKGALLNGGDAVLDPEALQARAVPESAAPDLSHAGGDLDACQRLVIPEGVRGNGGHRLPAQLGGDGQARLLPPVADDGRPAVRQNIDIAAIFICGVFADDVPAGVLHVLLARVRVRHHDEHDELPVVPRSGRHAVPGGIEVIDRVGGAVVDIVGDAHLSAGAADLRPVHIDGFSVLADLIGRLAHGQPGRVGPVQLRPADVLGVLRAGGGVRHHHKHVEQPAVAGRRGHPVAQGIEIVDRLGVRVVNVVGDRILIRTRHLRPVQEDGLPVRADLEGHRAHGQRLVKLSLLLDLPHQPVQADLLRLSANQRQR